MFTANVAILTLLALTAAQTTTLQAESATLSGVTIATSIPGYTGSGYVTSFDTSSDTLTFTLNASSPALYDLNLTYNGPYGDKYTYIVLNNGSGSQVHLPATTTWQTIPAGQVLIASGPNTIQIQSNWGWYLIDFITLSPSAARATHHIDPVPVTPNANADAKALLAYLARIYGKAILSGQQDQTSFSYIKNATGTSPAILGLDMMDYTVSRTSRGAQSSDVEHALAHAANGGIVTFVWHWGAPVGLYDSPEERWWSGFFSAATDFDVDAALRDEVNANYTLLMRDIDTIAVQLTRLRDAGVPVLWRPLHEAEGGWFWWGAKGPEACKKLYRLLYERLTNVHGLDNLIWVWNSVDPAWYPGPDVVDIVSADTYAQGDHGPVSATYNNLLALTNDTKIVAAAEIGSLMEPAQLKAYGADWVYFCVWSGEYVSGGTWNSLDLIRRIYGDEYVLTLEEVRGWRNGTTWGDGT